MSLIENTIVYLDTDNGNTVDGSGVITEATGAKLSPYPAMLHDPEATNFFLNSDVPVTQSITLTAGDYICWFDDLNGLGQIVLTGGATGTATSAAYLTFTASGASVTFTVSGSNNIRVQVEEGDYRTSYIPTAGAAVTRSADDISIPLVT